MELGSPGSSDELSSGEASSKQESKQDIENSRSSEPQGSERQESPSKAEEEQKVCRHCGNIIPLPAKICSYCHSSQSFIGGLFRITHFIPLIAVLVTAWQAFEARNERILALDAAKKAADSEVQVNEMRKRVELEAKELRQAQSQMLSQMETVNIAFIRREDGQYVPFEQVLPMMGRIDHTNGYMKFSMLQAVLKDEASRENFSNDVTSSNIQHYFLDLCELGLVAWLGENFGMHWIRHDSVGSTSSIFSRGTNRSFGFEKRKPENHSLISKKEMAGHLRSNLLLQLSEKDLSDLWFGELTLPPDSKLTYERSNESLYLRRQLPDGSIIDTEEIMHELDRRFIFSNEHYRLEIRIWNGVNVPLSEKSLEAQILKSKLGIGDGWWIQDIPVTFKLTLSPEHVFSEQSISIRRWYGQMVDQFDADFAWKGIAEDLQLGELHSARRQPSSGSFNDHNPKPQDDGRASP